MYLHRTFKYISLTENAAIIKLVIRFFNIIIVYIFKFSKKLKAKSVILKNFTTVAKFSALQPLTIQQPI